MLAEFLQEKTKLHEKNDNGGFHERTDFTKTEKIFA